MAGSEPPQTTGAEPGGGAPPGGHPPAISAPAGGGAPPSGAPPPAPAPSSPALLVVAPLVVGVALVSLIVGVAVFVPQPSAFQHSVFRAVLALGIACIAATIPGFAGAADPRQPGLAGVSGGLGAFLLVYLFDPMRRLSGMHPAAAAAATAAAATLGDRTIFICYRRKDTEETVGRLYEHLIRRFGKNSVFKDVNAILAGLDYRKELASALDRCRIVLAMIGPDWEKDATGARAIDQSRDYVHVEIASALKRGVPLIPVLLERRPALPAQSDLPPELHDLVYRQCLHLRPDPDFENDLERLIENIEALLARQDTATAARR